MALIYIVEDDQNIREIESFALKNSGYQVEDFSNAKQFYRAVKEKSRMGYFWISCFPMRMAWKFYKSFVKIRKRNACRLLW